MSGTFMAPIPPLSLSSTHHKRYHARPSTVHDHSASARAAESSRPTSLAHDLLAKHSAAKWLKKQRREYEVNHEIRKAKREAAKADEAVVVGLRAREGSESSTATVEGKMTAAFAG